jgi:hypothetical protein
MSKPIEYNTLSTYEQERILGVDTSTLNFFVEAL